jgi:CYTH domain-containing protein
MPLEIERKFLLRDDTWRGDWTRERLRQGYLTGADTATVRIRRAGVRAFLTIKAAVDRETQATTRRRGRCAASTNTRSRSIMPRRCSPICVGRR